MQNEAPLDSRDKTNLEAVRKAYESRSLIPVEGKSVCFFNGKQKTGWEHRGKLKMASLVPEWLEEEGGKGKLWLEQVCASIS